MKCGNLNPSPRQKQLVADHAIRLQSLSPQRHTNGPAKESPASSLHESTDDEKPTGEIEVDE